jgi:hypothetical protein
MSNLPDEILIDDTKYIKQAVDEYAELKEAQERGEVIQTRGSGGWYDRTAGSTGFEYPVDQYRIKPKVKKLYAFLFSQVEKSYQTIFFETKDHAEAYQDDDYTLIKQLDDEPIEIPD